MEDMAMIKAIFIGFMVTIAGAIAFQGAQAMFHLNEFSEEERIQNERIAKFRAQQAAKRAEKAQVQAKANTEKVSEPAARPEPIDRNALMIATVKTNVNNWNEECPGDKIGGVYLEKVYFDEKDTAVVFRHRVYDADIKAQMLDPTIGARGRWFLKKRFVRELKRDSGLKAAVQSGIPLVYSYHGLDGKNIMAFNINGKDLL